MSTTANDEGGRRSPSDGGGWVTPTLLALWFLAVVANIVIALNAISEMTYFELDIPSMESREAARPWVWSSMIGFVVLAILGWWMGSRWWQALLVASAGVVGLVQVRIEDNGPILALPFLFVAGIGAIATLFTARPFSLTVRKA